MKKIKIKNPFKKFSFKKIRRKWKGMSKKKKIIWSAIALILICAIVICVVFGTRRKSIQMPTATAREASVTTGSISNTIVGTGNLEADTSNAITVPSGITIKKVKVESGDSVSKGDTLATVDSASVLEAVETVQDEIDELDEEINDCEDSDDTETVTSKVGGTVKKIYVSTGDSVTDCIAENGALIVIRLDSGEKIKITSDGGTVTKIHVSKNEEVSSGDTLLTIETDEESTEYKKLIAERKALEKTLKQLVQLSQTGKIVADEDGIIGSVNVSAGSESSSDSGSSSGNTANTMSYSTSQNTINTLKTTTSSAKITMLSETETTEGDTKIELEVSGSGSTTKNNLVVSQPIAGNTPQTTITASDGSYSGTVQWSPDDSAFQASTTYSATVTLNAKDGYIFSTDSITKIYTGLISGITVSDQGKTISFTITFPATADSETETVQSASDSTEDTDSQDTSSDKTTGSTSGTTDSITNSGSLDTSTSSAQGSTSQSSGSTSASSSTSASGGSTSDDSAESSSGSGYSTDVTAFTMASDDSMILSVSVDELDINSVALDQEATITMDAIEDAEFTGTVTSVGNSASSSGSGVAKYTVEITIPKDSQMKEGMNASATIIIESKEDILTLPVDALQERGNYVYVYTEKDSDGNLSGEVEVTTGLSDGDTVEITEGLSEGDTVYYQSMGNSSTSGSSDSNESKGNGMEDMMSGGGGRGNGNFGGASGGDGGGMPSGGGMQQGGSQ